jgi:hypothetical protein
MHAEKEKRYQENLTEARLSCRTGKIAENGCCPEERDGKREPQFTALAANERVSRGRNR